MKKIILIIITVLVFLQIGCKSELEQEIVEIEGEDYVSIEVSSEDKVIIERSETLSDYIVELFGIDDVATIIFNDTALVGIVTSYDNELTDDLKVLINDLVMEKDNGIKEVLVSDDKNIFKEVVNIINDLMKGKTYDNYVGAITKMIGKVNKKN